MRCGFVPLGGCDKLAQLGCLKLQEFILSQLWRPKSGIQVLTLLVPSGVSGAESVPRPPPVLLARGKPWRPVGAGHILPPLPPSSELSSPVCRVFSFLPFLRTSVTGFKSRMDSYQTLNLIPAARISFPHTRGSHGHVYCQLART